MELSNCTHNSQYHSTAGLPIELWGYLSEFIKSNKEKCRLIITCKWISKCGFSFNEAINANLICHHQWYERFININDTGDVELHSNIKALIAGAGFNKRVYVPSSVVQLVFGRFFNQSIDNLPSSIKYLIFGEAFNYPIDRLPSSITHLTFGANFNQSIRGLPSSITHLGLGWFFNQPIYDCLPNSIIHLTF